jgi:hypothetical protein
METWDKLNEIAMSNYNKDFQSCSSIEMEDVVTKLAELIK